MENRKQNKLAPEILYIAYGSNLNLSQMKHRCPTAKVIGASEIKDYELVFRGAKYGAVATIEPCEGSKVPVLIWSICPGDEKALDRYEGYPSFYGKEKMDIVLNDSITSAMVYVMVPNHKLGMPSEGYKKSIEEGYVDAGFDRDILQNAVDKTIDMMDLMEENMIEEDMKNAEDIGGQDSLFGMQWW